MFWAHRRISCTRIKISCDPGQVSRHTKAKLRVVFIRLQIKQNGLCRRGIRRIDFLCGTHHRSFEMNPPSNLSRHLTIQQIVALNGYVH